MVVFSTGVAADEKDPGFAVPQPGTAFTGSETNLFPAPFHGPCAGNVVAPPMTLNDPAALTITAQAPPDATGFRFRFNFFTSEFPEFIGDQMADTFVVWLDSKALKKNIAFDANGDAITANSPSLQVCTPQQVCQGGRLVTCSAGAGGLAGTGYELDNGLGVMIGGATGWLSTSAPIAAGETFRVTFLIFDAGDHVLDSAVLIDNWEWVTR